MTTDTIARGLAAAAKAKILPRNALDAMAQFSWRIGDIVNIVDSTGAFGGYGWENALTKAHGNKTGIWASPFYPQVTAGTGYTTTGLIFSAISGATGAYTGADAAFDSMGLPDTENLYTASGDMGTSNGIYVSNAYPALFDVNANLRYHAFVGTSNTGSPSLTLGARRETSPFTALTTGSTISLNTGAIGETELTLNVAAGTRNYDVGFHLRRAGGTASVGPTVILAQRVQNIDKENGASIHNFYANGGQSLYDMALWAQGGIASPSRSSAINLARLMWGFGKLRAMQIARGYRPIIVVRICSGLNDRNETSTPSVGWRATGTPAGALAYADNLDALMSRIETGWRTNGWDMRELFFLVVPSYPTTTPDDMTGYRTKAALAAKRENVSFIDLNALVPYSETLANNGLSDGTHFTNAWADVMAAREVAQIPSA